MDARRILSSRSSGSRAEPTPYPSNKPGLAASVSSPHHRSHQPAWTPPSPQGLGHSIYLANFASFQEAQLRHFHHRRSQRRDRGRFSLPPLSPVLCSYTYRTCRELIPPAIKQSASTTSCTTPVTPPKAPSSSGYFITGGTASTWLAPSPTSGGNPPTATDAQASQTQRIRHDTETLALQPHAIIKNILEDVEDTNQPPRAAMEPYWTTVFTQPATVTMPECTQHPVQDSIARPIKAEEIRPARPSLAVSPGPDGLTAREFRAIPLGIIVRIFNLILWCVNLPKLGNLQNDLHFQEISCFSAWRIQIYLHLLCLFTRVLHKILAQRIDPKIEMDDQQRAFRAGMDGCRDNTVLLDAILRSRYQQFWSTFAATLDLARAFDSVEHSATWNIMRSAEAAGIPTSADKILQEPLRHQYHNAVGHRLVIRAY